ncbi:hypothetical protein BASA60_004983 [Batrachochytrium salamandrivorans]|nr:hypothetical protein BASA60_004983 [Batrachochytrium salamandrivorans]
MRPWGLVVSLQGAAGGTGGEAAAIVQEMARVDTLKKDIEWRVLDNPSEEKGAVVDDVQENENGGSAITTATVSKKLGKKAKAVKTATAAMDELPQLIDFAPIEQPIRVDPRTKRIGTKLGVKAGRHTCCSSWRKPDHCCYGGRIS